MLIKEILHGSDNLIGTAQNCPYAQIIIHTFLVIDNQNGNGRAVLSYQPRQLAAFPAKWLHDHKFWPPVGRIDNPYGDRNLVCVCPPLSDYEH